MGICFVRDATYALTMWTLAITTPWRNKAGIPDGSYAQVLATRDPLRGATFGLPWNSFWVHADAKMQAILLDVIALIEDAGATVINGTRDTQLPDNFQPQWMELVTFLASGLLVGSYD